MPRLKCNKSVIHSLLLREMLLLKSTYRTSLKTMKSIVHSESVTFNQVWKIGSKKPIIYTDRKLFLENYKKCLAICGRNGLPTPVYELDTRHFGKIEDCLLSSCPVNSPCFDNAANYKKSLLCLTSLNWLCNYDSETGQLLQSVYLGQTSRCHYRHIGWERQGETMTVMSVKNPFRALSVNPVKRCVLVVIIWFSILPLQFKALMEFDREVFGKECVHCNVSEGLLIVGTGSASTGMVRLYDFYEIVNEGVMYSCKIEESCEALDGERLGTYPAGIPVNCKVKELPPVLFQVQCSEYTLHFGGFPFHCVISIPKYPETFQISDVAGQKMVENGTIIISNSAIENCHVSFHGDDSGRIIHYSNTAVRFYKLVDGIDKTKRLQEGLIINLDTPVAKVPRQGNTSRPTRRLATKKKFFDDECGSFISDRIFICDDYENEIDVFAILSVTFESEKQVMTVQLFDNITEKKFKSVKINMDYDEFSEYDLIMDMDTMMIIEKTALGQYRCVMHQICNETDTCVKKAEKGKRKTRHNKR